MNKLHVLHLYPNEMNMYGDRGNLLTLVRRAQWHGFEPVVHFYHAKQPLPKHADIILGGGGQDSAQGDIQNDILRIGGQLHTLAQKGVPMLMICGMYQLFCHKFVTHDHKEIKGIGIFDAHTVASPARMVGNIKVQSDFGALYGFENHSGRTFLADNQQPLGRVLRGNGNNGHNKTEGARSHNVFGSYLHGPMLPNNPAFADMLISLAAKNVTGSFVPHHINDSLTQIVRHKAAERRY